ncbi:MAG: hypothetical protein C0467_23235 [Planctomycetaceae bacterium]|nr:hypothetical protein [Planctomycetaceae bacterium]
MPFGPPPRESADEIEFLDQRSVGDGISRGWAESIGGFGLTAVQQNGGVYARYPRSAPVEHSQYVLAFPGHCSPEMVDAEPSAWVVADSLGGPMVVNSGPDQEASQIHTRCPHWTKGSLLGSYGLRALAAERDGTGPAVEVIWKVERLYDLLTLHAALNSAGLLGRHVVVANCFGPLEDVVPEWFEFLAGKTVYVTHTRDWGGAVGANRWVEPMARSCRVIKDVRLPSEFENGGGESLRDFLFRDKRPVSELLALASNAPEGVRELPPFFSEASTRAITPPAPPSLMDFIPVPTQPEVNAADILRFARVETRMACARVPLAKRYRVSLNALSLAEAAFYPKADAAKCKEGRLPEQIGVKGDSLLLPLSDVRGEVGGLFVIPFGDRLPVEVGGPGIVAPCLWDEIPGIVVVTQNPLDALAFWTIGVCAVAVPNFETGLPILIETIRQRGMADRGWFCVGPGDWAAEVAEKLREAGIELAFWCRSPVGYSNYHQWVADRIPSIACQKDLEALGNGLAGIIESVSVPPGEPYSGWPENCPLPTPSDLPEAAIEALCPEPPYRKYLSLAARTRGMLSQMELHSAEEAALAASRGEEAERDRWVRIGVWASLVADEEFEATERAVYAARPVTAGNAPTTTLQYVVAGGCICQRGTNANGEIEDSPLCNFAARITGEVSRDDGAETTTNFSIVGSLQGGRQLPEIEVRADEYDKMEWVTPGWGAQAIVYAVRSARNHLRVAIQYLSGRIHRRTAYAHTGWRQVEGRWVYLHGGGAIGGSGAVAKVEVKLPDSLGRMVLPESPILAEQDRDIRSSLRLLDRLAPDRVVYPLVAAVWRAVLGDTDLTVAMNGLTGSFKSELASLAQRHWGKGLDARHLPANWSSSGNSLEALAHAAKDTLTTIDDFCPPNGPDAARYHQKADQVLRAAGNSAGRQRMRADTSLRPDKPPRCLILSTGEESPRGQSLQARMMQIDVEPGAVNTDRLTDCQRDAASGCYARAMAAYLRWLAPQYARMKAGLAAEVEGERDLVARSGQHRRTPAIVAELLVGLTWFLRFAQEVGAITPEEALAHETRCREALCDAAVRQTDDQGAEEPASKFLRLLAATIASGKAHIAGADGLAPGEPLATDGAPPDNTPARWGWRLRTTGVGDGEWQPLGPCVGWVVGADLYLEPDSSYAAACALAREQGDGFHVGARTIRKRLRELGFLATRDSDRGQTVRRSLGGVPNRPVVHIKACTLTGAKPKDLPQEPDNPAQDVFDSI